MSKGGPLERFWTGLRPCVSVVNGVLLWLLWLCIDGSDPRSKWILGLAVAAVLLLVNFVGLRPSKQEAITRLVGELGDTVGAVVTLKQGMGPFGLGSTLEATITPTPEEDAARIAATGGGE